MLSLHSSSTMNGNPSDKHRSAPWFIVICVVMMRLVVGGLFAFSGFVKAVDPWGTFYKVSEYIMALDWESVAGLSLFVSFALPAVELLLGVAIIFGCYRRGAPVAALLLLMVMLPLTLWLALTNAVPDCGCFGDALVMSNWATFGKNVLLTMGVIFLIVFGRGVRGLFGPAVQWMVMAATFVATMAIAFQGYFTQPLIDFRPYKVGMRLTSSQPSASDEDYLFVYEKDGVTQEFAIDDAPDEEDGWTFVARREREHAVPQAQQGQRPVAVTDHGTDMADEMLANERLLLFLFPDLPQVSIATTFVINELTDNALAHGIKVYGITSASYGQIAEWTDVSMANYPMLVADDSEIKMMARGNPAVVYVKEGEITWKRTLSSITSERIHDAELTFDTMGDDMKPTETLRQIVGIYVGALIVVLLINRTHLLFRPLLKRRRRANSGDKAGSESEYSQD